MRFALLFLAACDLQTVSKDTGTLEKLRIVHLAQDADGGVLHIVDKEANRRDVFVRVGMCSECSLTTRPEDALVIDGYATRVHASLWEFHFDLQPFFAAGQAGILASASDGVTNDTAYVDYDSLATAAPFPIEITVDGLPLRENSTHRMVIAPVDSARWYVSANARVTNRKGETTRLELTTAKRGDKVYVFAVTQQGLGALASVVLDVE